MKKTKLLASILLATMILLAQIGSAGAAPLAQTTTPITGTIQSITLETDSTGTTTVLVTLLDAQNVTQTVRLSVDTAAALGLVTLDPVTNQPAVDDTQVGQPVEIDPVTVIADAPTTEEAPVHPIAALLAAFFGADPSEVNDFHENGFGFGVIAQAMWMSKNLNGDASLAGSILEAKKSGDYSAFALPDGSVPDNWGQFKKLISEKHNNLGSIVSGNAEQETSTEVTNPQQNGNGKGHGQGNGKGKDKGKGKNKP